MSMEGLDEILVSSWYNACSSVPSSYIQPPECRPGNLVATSGKTIPVVDLGVNDRADIVKHILKASVEYGLFQVLSAPPSSLHLPLTDRRLYFVNLY